MSGEQTPDPRAVWLRSLGWNDADKGAWSGQVATTKGGRYRPMSLEHAFEVALKRAVIEKAFVVDIVDGRVRLALPWREVDYQDRDHAG